MPVLIVMGDRDMLTIEHAETIQQALPTARLEVVPDATHGLPMEQPDVVSRLILDFLETTQFVNVR